MGNQNPGIWKTDQIIKAARDAKLQLKADGHYLHAEAVQSLIMARITSANTSSGHYSARRRLTALLRRAHDAMSRREPDGVPEAEWDQLLADIAKEIGNG